MGYLYPMNKRPICFLSSLPPPNGGISTWTKKIVDSGLPDGTELLVCNTNINPGRAKLNIVTELSRTFRIMVRLSYQLIVNKPKLVHMSCSLSPIGVFRDLFFVIYVRLFRIPVVSHYRGNLIDFPGHYFYGLSGRALRSLVTSSEVNIVENLPSYKMINEMRLNPETLFLLPNFVEDSLISKEKKENFVSVSSRYRALFVGRITQNKGIKELLVVATHFPNIDFFLLGYLEQDVRAIIDSFPKNIILLGDVSPEVVPYEMKKSDFLLFPSYTEGFPLAVVEAMAVGLPVIATRVGGIPEMIDEGLGGLLVEPRDAGALSEAIRKLFSDRTLSEKMGEYNRKKCFQYYRYSVVIQQLISIYNNVLHK